jgi:hypothetical protein
MDFKRRFIMTDMIDVMFEKLYRYDRLAETCGVCIPVRQGRLFDIDGVAIYQNGVKMPSQTKVTSRHADGSVRYMYVRFQADLPGNKGTVLKLALDDKGNSELNKSDTTAKTNTLKVTDNSDGFTIDTGVLKFTVMDGSDSIFDSVNDGNKIYTKDHFVGPVLTDGNGINYDVKLDKWRIVEQGDVCVILTADGENVVPENLKKSGTEDKKYKFELRLTAYAGKPWIEVSYRIFNTSDTHLHIASLCFYVKAGAGSNIDNSLTPMKFTAKPDSTGCGDTLTDNSKSTGPVYFTRGTTELPMFDEKIDVAGVRTLVGISNYKTDFYIGRDGCQVNRVVDDKHLINEANEHYAEVLYGTFMADRTDGDGGVCVTVYQAQQNYPKAVKADKEGIAIMLVPEGVGRVVMQSGMAREQKFLMHFHAPSEPIAELDNRSLIYQMPDKPFINPDVFKEAGVMIDVFPEKKDDDVEIALISKGDAHSRSYGMLNWGDTVDSNYTRQGRGNGRVVWSNNEYDFPHSCALEYARTGIRRFHDYLVTSASHWMDVDVCHYSRNMLRIGGQWEHTAGHCENGLMVCSHEWVEGLLDYYHFTGDERGFETALGIADNVLRLLDTPMYAKPGEANARETGWALRTLTAMYVETGDKRWLDKCEWIIGSFKVWTEEYGEWLAPYTDNTTVRVGFMISVAVGSVMRYYRVFPREDLKEMLLKVIDDLIENCLLDVGLFYYKELPSLARLGGNNLLLESLAIGYELTGDEKYLEPGLKTFKNAVMSPPKTALGAKKIVEDAVIVDGDATKGFAQGLIPLITYYKAVSETGLWENYKK